jgi:hypothetical protein
VVRGAQTLRDVAGLAELVQILADAEASTRAGDDDGTHLRLRRLRQRLGQRRVQRTVEGVEHVGTVERDPQDGAVALREHLVRHGTGP